MSEGSPSSANTPSRILKATHVNAELSIARRQADAAQILEKARQASSEMLALAREQGLNQGRNTIIHSTLEEVQRILSEFSTMVLHREDKIADLVMQSIEKIIGQAPLREQMRMLISTALTDMLESFTVVLKVSAEDLAMVRDVLINIQAERRGENVISVLVDPLLNSGEMLLETERGRIQIGLAQQLARLRAGFHQAAQPRS